VQDADVVAPVSKRTNVHAGKKAADAEALKEPLYGNLSIF